MVGNQTTVPQVNGTLTSLAIQLRELMGMVIQQQSYLDGLGTAGLNNLGGAGLGFSTAANPANPGGVSDAQYVLNLVNQMGTVAGVYKGTVQAQGTGGTGAVLFNFESAFTPLWAGQ
jgi:hypothetical protein